MKTVVSAIILREGKLLIVKDKEKEFWTLPGGKVEEGESFLEALEREIKEELPFLTITDIKIYREVLGTTPHSKEKVRVITFLAEGSGSIHLGAEVTGSKWANVKELRKIKLVEVNYIIVESLLFEGRL